MGAFRDGLAWFFRRVVAIYFRDIEATGDVPSPETGGRLFVANHVNALVDPILVLTTAPCPISPVAKSTLWKVPGLRWLLDAVDAVPLVRRRDDPTKKADANEAVFERVAGWLARGGNILVFPEGTSHNEPHLLELKTGAARMLERAFGAGASDATVQSVALEFDARDVFRSRCLLVYGPVRRARDFFAQDAPRDEPPVEALTRALRDDLSELLVEAPTWRERLRLARLAEILANDAADATAAERARGETSLARRNEVGRQIEAARRMLAGVDEATVESIGGAVDRYYGALAAEGLVDAQLAPGGTLAPPDLPLSLFASALALPLAAAAVALYWLPYQLPRIVALRVASDPDEVSTYKIGVGLLVYPLWVGALAAVSFWRLPAPWAALATALVVLAPFAALTFRDVSRPLRRALLLARRGTRIRALRDARLRIVEEVEQTRARLGV